MDSDFYYRRPPQPPPASVAERDLSWKCEVCGYHVLCMDQSGKGLPLEPGPNGKIIPMPCPRCKQEHSHWTPTSPFDAFGDHANLPSALSSRVTHGASIFETFHKNAVMMSQQQHQQYHQNTSGKNNSMSTTPQQGTLLLAGSTSASVSANSQNLSLSQQGSRSNTPGTTTNRGGVIENLLQQQQNNTSSGGGDQNSNLQQQSAGSGSLNFFPNPSTRTEYESLADHDALKDPDVIEALQRLRRRRGAYHRHNNNSNNNDQSQQPGSRFSNLYASAYGDSTNSPNTFSSFLFKSNNNNSGSPNNNTDGLTEDQISRLPESSLQRAAAHRNTAPKALECYVCGVCNRRLLRIDHRGELIPIESNAQGALTAIECPGCHQTHSRWLRVMLNGTTSSSASASSGHNNNNNYGGGDSMTDYNNAIAMISHQNVG